jgi:ubiquinone/menaquinone biosynthesis C-methylase UbiE/uncharacterized protein YbaR (Trm112 family)
VRKLLVDLLCCVECGHFPLELTSLEERELSRPVGSRSCERHCARGENPPSADGGCPGCLRDDVETGYLFCLACERFYFIVGGIPRLLGEDFRDLIDWTVPAQHELAFRGKQPALERFRERLDERRTTSDMARWNLDDVQFWQDEVYGKSEEVARVFEQLRRARPDAGNRSYPREQTIFRHVRPHLRGGVLVDVGCGLAQTIRLLSPPAEWNYVYVGLDLSISALTENRRTMAGDFIQCSGDQLPFRDSSIDALVMLGTLHHLARAEQTVHRALGCLRPGGFFGIHEVARLRNLSRRSRLFKRRDNVESAHNESIDLDVVTQGIQREADVVEARHRYSPVRAVLADRFAEAMRSRPWLTRFVLVLDDACIATLGRIWSFFGPREVVLLAQKRARVETDARPQMAVAPDQRR